MFNSNVIIQDFIANNWMAITILINLLQGIAWLTPSVKDDKVVTLISQTFEAIRDFKLLRKDRKGKENGAPGCVEKPGVL